MNFVAKMVFAITTIAFSSHALAYGIAIQGHNGKWTKSTHQRVLSVSVLTREVARDACYFGSPKSAAAVIKKMVEKFDVEGQDGQYSDHSRVTRLALNKDYSISFNFKVYIWDFLTGHKDKYEARWKIRPCQRKKS